MAAMEKLLSGFDVRVAAFEVCELGDGLRLDFAPAEEPALHYVLDGAGSLTVGDAAPVPVSAATVVIVPPGRRRTLVAGGPVLANGGAPAPLSPSSHCCRPLTQGLASRGRAGNGQGQGQETQDRQGLLLACGGIGATYGDGTGVFDRLQDPVVECFANCQTGSNAFRSLLDELVDPRLGSRALAETLMKQCLILVLRRLAQRQEERPAWLAALQDPRLAQAVEAMLEAPEAPHRLEQLAAVAGMSRASFSAHFIAAFGQSPHDFLVESRMRRAAKLLQTTNLPVKTVAAKVGYRSRSNFTRAFKAFYGTVPAGSRRKAAE